MFFKISYILPFYAFLTKYFTLNLVLTAQKAMRRNQTHKLLTTKSIQLAFYWAINAAKGINCH